MITESDKLYYSNKLQGISMVVEMIAQELDQPILNEIKINHMLAQIVCLAEVD